MFVQAKEVPKLNGAPDVENGSCIRCHKRTVSETTSANGIRVRHSDFVEGGERCAVVPRRDGAPRHADHRDHADDGLVHHVPQRQDSVLRVRDLPLSRTLPPTPISRRSARSRSRATSRAATGATSRQPCNSCHGTTMPHPEGWMSSTGYPGHAREGFANRDSCFRCHFEGGTPATPPTSRAAVTGCSGTSTVGQPWVKEHGLQATGQKPGQFSRVLRLPLVGDLRGAATPRRTPSSTTPWAGSTTTSGTFRSTRCSRTTDGWIVGARWTNNCRHTPVRGTYFAFRLA